MSIKYGIPRLPVNHIFAFFLVNAILYILPLCLLKGNTTEMLSILRINRNE